MEESLFLPFHEPMLTTAQAIENSPAFQNWCRAFRDVSGIDIHLLSADSIAEDLRNAAQSLELCHILCRHSARCASLCQADRERFAKQLRAVGSDRPGPFAMRCFGALTITALPVPLADETTAFLSTGPILLKSSDTESPVDSILRHIAAIQVEFPRKPLHRQPPPR